MIPPDALLSAPWPTSVHHVMTPSSSIHTLTHTHTHVSSARARTHTRAFTPPRRYTAWHSSVTEGTSLGKDDTKVLAKAIMHWAMERGATQFSHQFYPMRGAGAGTKLDSFISLDFGSDDALKQIVSPSFSGGMLFNSETDGSSFPNGGLRATHTAAAYMAWDRSSPPYVKGDTLYFPCAFMTWNGDALDVRKPCNMLACPPA